MVSELGELGHRQGEALSKIDSLGLQLTNLLDPVLLDVSVFLLHVFVSTFLLLGGFILGSMFVCVCTFFRAALTAVVPS